MGITADLSLRSIVDSAMLAVCGAAGALRQIYGDTARNQPNYRSALIELAIVINAALTAAAVSQRFQPKLGSNLGVAYGVFNLQNHSVGLPGYIDGVDTWQAGLWEAPQAPSDFNDLALQMARSRHIAQHLA
jgi:carbonic anhydrase